MKKTKLNFGISGFRGLLATGLFSDSLFDEIKQKAEQGRADAQFNLGWMYAKGEGVLEDYVEAYAWWALATMNGEANAVKGKGIIKELMSPSQLAAGQERARELLALIDRKQAIKN